jgi:HK97 family phage major capsid protein
MDWEPYENSLVTVPADPTVGVGREAEGAPTQAQPAAVSTTETKTAEAHTAPWLTRRKQLAEIAEETTTMPEVTNASAGVSAEDTRIVAGEQSRAGSEFEKQRISAIEKLCRANKIDESVRLHWVGTGQSIDEVAEDLLKIVEQRQVNAKPVTDLGLSPREVRQFSLFRAVQAAADKNWTQAGFELECTREIAKRLQKMADPNTFFIPYDVMTRPVEVPVSRLSRDLTAASAGAGGYLVDTVNVGFIDILRNRSVAYRMGARRLPGLQGNVTIPRQSGAATAVWLANEASTITESAQTFQQVALSPKSVGAYTEISRQLLLQSSPGAEGLVTADLAAVTATAVDSGVISGSGGSGQPQGIIGTSGVGSVTGTSLAYAGVLEFQTDVAAANVMPAAGGYVTTPAVAALMMQRARFSNTDTPLWAGNVWDGTMAGFQAMSSLQLPTANMLFGDWSQVIVGEWGVLQVDVNPYANFQAGIIGIRAITSIDVALRYGAAFSLATSIT